MEARTSEDRIVAIYRETIDQLYAYVARQCGGDRALAEDVTQEACSGRSGSGGGTDLPNGRSPG